MAIESSFFYRLPALSADEIIQACMEQVKSDKKPTVTIILSHGITVRGHIVDRQVNAHGNWILSAEVDNTGRETGDISYFAESAIQGITLHQAEPWLVEFSKGKIDAVETTEAPSALVLRRSIEDLAQDFAGLLGKKIDVLVDWDSIQISEEGQRGCLAQLINFLKIAMTAIAPDAHSLDAIKIAHKWTRSVVLKDRILHVAVNMQGSPSDRYKAIELKEELNRLF